MKLRAIKIDKRFIPEWNDNKKLPSNEQVVIEFSRIPATSEEQNYKGFKFDSSGTMQLVYNDNMLVSTFVSKVHNLEIGDEKIKTGAELATANNPLLKELFTEIRAYLFPSDEELTAGE
jgi:hypothetical protein